MASLNTILCAIDFSDLSRVAMEFAADMAARYGARLTLVHVCEPPPDAAAKMLLSPEMLEGTAREMERPLGRWGTEAQQLVGKPVQVTMLRGGAADEIVRYSREHRFDLIVVGTHGRTGLKRLVLGSVAERVARMAPCAVLVARKAEDVEED